ncbi:DUF4232 domain-containing protein [Streptomyces sp. NBC_01261]|uniref:DUF4232 domain-containing protein n=1 Tax=unclassified Streptomyces TaxID=2593676 RepID=UPI002E2A993A|nr:MULTISPECIES: DUF4232 domain-containing protein [unclassified Streptomyces]
MRTNRKITVTLVAVAVLAGAAGAGVAQAAPAANGSAAPSACRPANHTAKITEDTASAGHRHYRVTLTAPRGYEACKLAGSPTDVRFTNHGSGTGITAHRYGGQRTAVTFGPGHPVHFDIQVPNNGRGKAANEASFTLRTPGGGQIPGTSFAEGRLKVATGTQIGPVQRGA